MSTTIARQEEDRGCDLFYSLAVQDGRCDFIGQ